MTPSAPTPDDALYTGISIFLLLITPPVGALLVCAIVMTLHDKYLNWYAKTSLIWAYITLLGFVLGLGGLALFDLLGWR